LDRQAQFEHVIGSLYDAAAEPERWPEALTAAADLLGAVGAQFFLWDKQNNATPFSIVGRLPEEGNEAYLRYYSAFDTRRQALERVPVGKVAAYDLEFDEGRFRKSEFFNDFLAPHSVPYVAGSRLLHTAGQSAVIAVLRNFRQGPFGDREVAALGRLVPHLRRAARLHLRMHELRRQSQAVEAALDRLPFGVVIANAAGRALIVNRAAADMAAANDGLLLRDRRLATARAEEAAALACHIAEAVRTAGKCNGEGGGSLLVTRPSGRRPFAVVVAPLSPDATLAGEHPHPAALVLITDLERQPRALGRRLVDLFGLTPAEACLGASLATGKRLEDIAVERGVRMPTLRTQLRAILDKTGTRRQADLVRLIVGLPALRMR